MKHVFAILALVLVCMSVTDANAYDGRGRGHWQGHGQWHGQGHPGGQYNWDHHHHRRHYPRPVYPAPAPLPPPIEQRVIIDRYQYPQDCQTYNCAPVQRECYQPECAPVQQAPCYEQAECPALIPNTIPEQSYYCPQDYCQQPQLVLPYPGQQVRPIPLPGRYGIGAHCAIRQVGHGIFAIIQNNSHLLYRGVYQNVQYMLNNYRRSGVCR